MKYKALKITALVLSVLLLSLIGVRISYVNISALQPVTEYFETGEKIALEGSFGSIVDEYTDSYFVTLHRASLTTFGEFSKRFGGDENLSIDELTPNSKIIDLEVTIKNEGNTNGYIDLAMWGLQTANDEWIPCFELWDIEFPQTAGSRNFVLRSDTEMKLHIPFETNNDYETLYGDYPIEDSYNFVISRAPVKKIIKITL